MKHITFAELAKNMRDFNNEHVDKWNTSCIYGVIVYKEDNWKTKYSLESRSYQVSNANKMFRLACSNSLFGYNLDGTDIGVRLDLYDWEIDYCYMEEK